METLVLSEVAASMIAELPDHHAGRTARTIVHGDRMRAVVVALASGSELAEHDAPPAATLQVLTGTVRLVAGDDSWPLTAGELVTIPLRRHSVQADSDAAILLTVAID